MILLTPMVEILDLLMEALNLVKSISPYPLRLQTDYGPCNGLGLEVLSLLETTTHASITKFLVDLLEVPQRHFTTEEITRTLDKTYASFSTLIDFTNALTSHATTQSTLFHSKRLDQHSELQLLDHLHLPLLQLHLLLLQ